MDISSLHITPELLRLIAELDEFKGAWRVRQDQSPELLKTLRKVATIESIGSSTRIEGSKLTDSEIENLLSSVGRASFLTRDEQEVAGYAEVMETIFENHLDIPLTENYFKQLHSTLLRHSEKDSRHRGEYKKHSNSVEAFDPNGKSMGVVFETTSPFDTPEEMRHLVEWARETLADKSIHPLIMVALFNVVFLAIHPFQDGNGRLSRVLVNLLLLQSGYSYLPYASLESVIEKNKEAYYLALQRTQRTLKNEPVDWHPWLHFFVTSLKRHKDHLIQKTKISSAYAHLPKESVLIMEYVETHQRITINEASEMIDTVSRATIKNRLNDLVKDSFLTRHGKARGTWYGKL